MSWPLATWPLRSMRRHASQLTLMLFASRGVLPSPAKLVASALSSNKSCTI